MISFFINGSMKIIKYDYLPENNTIDFYEYEMRFLTETSHGANVDINIIIYDEFDNKIESHYTINGLQLIKIDVTPFIETYNHQHESYIKVNYIVKIKNQNKTIRGSLPIISPNHDDTLKFATVSCNDNNSNTNKDINLWKHLGGRNPDIIFHTGDQIYSDNIFDNSIGYESDGTCNCGEIYSEYANLYRTAYGEASQGQVMRNCINIMMINSHDISRTFGSHYSFHNKSNPYFTPYYTEGMKAYLNYQHQLHTDLTQNIDTSDDDGYELLTTVIDDYDNIIQNNAPIYYNINYGKYCIIVLDERHDFYNTNNIFSIEQLRWIANILNKTDKSDILIISPIPIGNFNKIESFIVGVGSYEGLDELFHPNNYDQTIELLNILNDHKENKNYTIFSGNIRKTFINIISKTNNNNDDENDNNNNMQIRQLVSSGISKLPSGYDSVGFRLMNWLFQHLNCICGVDITDGYIIAKKDNISYNYNYGFLENDELSNYYVEEYNDELYLSCLNY